MAYSTYLGGTARNYGFGIAVDSFMSAYVAGYTESTNFPTTVNAFLAASPPGSTGVAFVTKLGLSNITPTYLLLLLAP